MPFNMKCILFAAFVACAIFTSVDSAGLKSVDPSEVPNYNCSRKCAFKFATTHQNHDSMNPYFDCMKKCVTENWILFQSNKTCLDEFVESGNQTITCKPIDIKVHEFDFQLKPGKPKVGYLLFIWKPCPYGRDAVKGYQIETRAGANMLYPLCWRLELTRFLARTEEITFTALYPKKLAYLTTYQGEITSFPYKVGDTDRLARYHYNSKACSTATPNVCDCLSSMRIAPPNITISGYTVTISVEPVLDCFPVKEYHMSVGIKLPNKKFGAPLQFYNLPRKNLDSGKAVTATFHHIYPGAVGSYMTAGVYLYMLKQAPNLQRFAKQRINITAWEAEPRMKELEASGAVRASFRVAGADYGIERYSVRLNFHPEGDDSKIEPVSIRNFTAVDDADNGTISTKYYKLKPGLWSVQVREFHVEVRQPKYHRIEPGSYQKPNWSARSEIRILTMWQRYANSSFIPIFAVIVVLALLVLVAIVFLYSWKKGLCAGVRYYVPDGVAKWLDSQTTSELNSAGEGGLKSRKVLLVWQADTRSVELGEKHANVVRHLASFLCSVCGLEVILDMFEETQVSVALSKWIHDSYEKAEFVVFICPHFDCDLEPEDGLCRPLVGDFNYLFRYLEPHIKNRRKFVTALLPYSDVASSTACKWLANCTRVFRLMDHIEDLYFHIQERSKVNLIGRNSVEFINRKDYVNTPQGGALSSSIDKFVELNKSSVTAVSSPGKKRKTKNSSTSSISFSSYEGSGSSAVEESNSRRSSDFLRSSRDSDVGPVLVANSLALRPPAKVSCLCRRHVGDPIHPPPPLVDDPEEQLRLLNIKDAVEAGGVFENRIPKADADGFCPFHGKRISASFTDDGYGDSATTNPDLSGRFHDQGAAGKQDSDDEEVMRFLQARSLLPTGGRDLVQLDIHALPAVATSSSSGLVSDFSSSAHTGSRPTPSDPDLANYSAYERYSSV